MGGGGAGKGGGVRAEEEGGRPPEGEGAWEGGGSSELGGSQVERDGRDVVGRAGGEKEMFALDLVVDGGPGCVVWRGSVDDLQVHRTIPRIPPHPRCEPSRPRSRVFPPPWSSQSSAMPTYRPSRKMRAWSGADAELRVPARAIDVVGRRSRGNRGRRLGRPGSGARARRGRTPSGARRGSGVRPGSAHGRVAASRGPRVEEEGPSGRARGRPVPPRAREPRAPGLAVPGLGAAVAAAGTGAGDSGDFLPGGPRPPPDCEQNGRQEQRRRPEEVRHCRRGSAAARAPVRPPRLPVPGAASRPPTGSGTAALSAAGTRPPLDRGDLAEKLSRAGGAPARRLGEQPREDLARGAGQVAAKLEGVPRLQWRIW